MPNKWNLEEYNTEEDKWNLEKYTPPTKEDNTSDFNPMQVLEGVYDKVNQAEAKPNQTSSAASNYLSGSKIQETNQPDTSYSNMPAEQNIPEQPEKTFEERNNIFNNPEYQKKSLVDKAGTITTNILNTVAGSGASLGAGVASAGDMLVDLSMQRDIQTPMEDYAEKSQQFAQERFEAGSWNDNLNVIGSLKEGKIGEAISKGVQGALQNSAQLATITTMGILTGGASNAATSGLLNSTGAITQAAMQNAPLALIGASAGGGQYASLDDREDLSINQKVTSGLTATAIESATETYGSLNWLDDIMRSTPGARSQVVDSVFDIARRSIDPKKVAINAGEEALEEITAGFSNEIANSIMGINDKSLPEVIMNYEDYLNQGIIGGFSGAGMSIGAQIANTVMTPTQQQEQSPEDIDLSNQISQQYNLPQETVDKIQSDISQIINSDPSEILQDSETEEDNGIITTYQPDNQVDVEQTTEETQQEQTTEPIDLSNTSQNQLLTVPGIGNKTSSNIMEYINENGIESVDDLANVSGVGQATLDKIRDKFTVGETITGETTEQEVETPVEETIEEQIEETPEEVEGEATETVVDEGTTIEYEQGQAEEAIAKIDRMLEENVDYDPAEYEAAQNADVQTGEQKLLIMDVAFNNHELTSENRQRLEDKRAELQSQLEDTTEKEQPIETEQEVTEEPQQELTVDEIDDQIDDLFFELEQVETETEQYELRQEIDRLEQQRSEMIDNQEGQVDTQQETEINQEQLSEMAKEYSSPDEFMENVVGEYGYLPDLGLNEYNDFREFWADNTDIDNITSAPRTTLDEFDLSFDSELPDVSLEITDNITTEGRAENNTIQISNEVAETSNEQELKTVLAHEYAHNLIDNNENVRNIVNSNPDNILGSFNQITEQFEGVTDFGINGNESFVDLFANYLYDTENFQNNYPKQYELMDSLFGNQQQEIKNNIDNLYNEIRPTQQETETADTLNLNSATIDDLTEINGIGASTAQNIINYRDSKENGIESVDDLKQVKGIGSATFDKIAPSFTAEQVDTTDTTDAIEEPTDSDITVDDDVESEAENLDADEIASEVDDVEGSITQTNELLSEEARDLMEFEDTDIREYLDVVLRTSLDDLQTATEIERNNIIDEIREDDPDVADAIEAELEERFYEFGEPLKNMLKNFAERSETGVEMEDVERYLQSARIKNQQLANRLQLPEIREEAIAQAYNLALQMEAQIQSADMDAEAEQGELLMGYFAQNEEGQRIIKVRDIVDLENVGHEIGHMVHYELFGNPDITDFVGLIDTENLLNLLEIQVDDYNNIPDETVNLMNKMTEDLEATIKSEMLKISYDVVRPIKENNPFMARYRASNSELMADYWVAYLTNHALAYDMAPKTTKMYDYALSKQENQNISNMVKTIRETLQQTSDNPDLKLQLITPEMAANLNPDKGLDLTTQAEKITAGADALIQEQKSFARLNVSDWAQVIPEEMQEDIIFYIEGTDNPIKGKPFEQIKQEIESNEEALQAVREIRYNFERVRQEWNNILREADSETRINYIENYAPRIWEDNKTVVNGFYRSYNGGTTPQASQARYYPTVVEGMEAGLTPETTNILTLYKDYVDRNARPIAMNSFKNYMLDLTDENGNPIVLTEDELAELYHNNPKYSDVKIIDGREFKPELRENVRKKRYVRSHDNLLSNNQNMLIREDVYRYAREHLQKPIQKLKPISETNNLIKSLNYLFSGFHAFDLVFESGSGGLHFVKSPVTLSGNKYFDSVLPWERGMKLASYKPFLRTAIHSGLKINPMEDAFVGKLADATEKVVKWAENSPIPFAEKPLQMFETAESKWQEIMWGKLYTGSKLNSFYGVLETQKDVLPDNPSEEQIRAFYEAAADQVNQMYGGQDWSRIPIMSPQLRQVAHLAIRAPDWTLSNLKIAGRVFKPHIENLRDYGLTKPEFENMTTDQQLEDIRRRVVAKESSKYFAKMVIGVSIMMNILNFATVGRPTWENEGSIGTKFNLDVTPIVHKIQEILPFLERDEDDERRYYAMPFKQIREVFNFVQSPAQTIGYKTSPISQLAFEQIYGSQAGSGYDLGFYDDRADTLEKIGRRISRGAQTITPFTFSGTNFALTLPLRRGISEYRAILEYEDSIENKLLREDTLISDVQNQFSLARDINDIDKEVLHNGLNPLKLNETAVTNLKRKYAAQLFEGITDEDTEKAEEAATALRRLRYFDISSTAEARKEDYMTEVEAIQLMANPEIVSKVQPLPLDILNPALRFEDETLTELYQDMQREVGE